jgi:hypothetical protein
MHLFQQHAPADPDTAIAQIPIIDFGPYFAGRPDALAPLAEQASAFSTSRAMACPRH